MGGKEGRSKVVREEEEERDLHRGPILASNGQRRPRSGGELGGKGRSTVRGAERPEGEAAVRRRAD